MKNVTLLFAFFLLGGLCMLGQNFRDAELTPFIPVSAPALAFADVDGDSDMDVIVTGTKIDPLANLDETHITKLYINDGTGSFSEVDETPFEGVATGSIAFADIDQDNDLDVLILGSFVFRESTRLYTNDGKGNFTEVEETSFRQKTSGDIEFVDVDGDNDMDVFICGDDKRFPSLGEPTKSTELYINDGAGNFSLDTKNTFVSVTGEVALDDIDLDGDMDLLVMGLDDFGEYNVKLYKNDGSGTFSEVMNQPFAQIAEGNISFADVDNDGDNDVFISALKNEVEGQFSQYYPQSRLYLNDGEGNFSEKPLQESINKLGYGKGIFEDFDGDGDKDLLHTGAYGPLIVNGNFAKEVERTILYTNDGKGNFTEVTNTPFPYVNDSAPTEAVDVDGDGDMDIALVGTTSYWPDSAFSKIYFNESIATSIDPIVKESNTDFELYPNPVSGSTVQLVIDNDLAQIYEVGIFDLQGKSLSHVHRRLQKGKQTLSLDISSLAKGSYIVEWESNTKRGYQKMLIQ